MYLNKFSKTPEKKLKMCWILMYINAESFTASESRSMLDDLNFYHLVGIKAKCGKKEFQSTFDFPDKASGVQTNMEKNESWMKQNQYANYGLHQPALFPIRQKIKN